MSTFASRKKTSFKGDIARLVSGTAIAQGIGILFAPIVTRLYAPEAYGVASIFAAIVGIISVASCLRYEIAICLPEKDEDGANLLGACLLSTLLITGLLSLLIGLAGSTILDALRMPELTPYLWLVPIAVGLHGVFTALNYWNTRTKHFSRLSIAKVTGKVGTTGTILGAGFSGHATGGSMILASILGSTISTLVLGAQIIRDNGKFFWQHIRLVSILPLLRRYKKFPQINLWSTLLNNASWKLPAILLAYFFSPAVVGMYALGFTMVKMPMSLIGGAISQVFLQKASAAKNKSQLAPLVENSFAILLVCSLVPLSVLMVSGEIIFSYIFGERWGEAGEYVEILALWAAFWFISSPLSMLFSVLEKQSFGLKINIAIFLSRFVSIAIGGFYQDVKLALWLFSISGILVYGCLNISILLVSGVEFKRVVFWIASCVVLALLCCLIFLLFRNLGFPNWMLVISAGVISVFGVFVGFLIAKRKGVLSIL